MSIKYTPDHEWIQIDGDVATVGITHHAQDALGDVVFVELPEVGKSYAQQDVAGYEAYAKKIRRFFATSPETLEHVLDGLFYIAAADGLIHESELDYLRTVSDIFGFDEARFEQLTAQHVLFERGADPYAVLGLMPGAERDEVRRVYRSLVAEHHPDRLIAKGVPEELIEIATGRMAAINDAYNRIMKPPLTLSPA